MTFLSLHNTTSQVYASRSNPCPICGSDHGCRTSKKQSDLYYWCLRKGEMDVSDDSDYKYSHDLGNNMGASWLKISASADSNRKAGGATGQPFNKEYPTIPDEVLNETYRKAIAQLQLSEYHQKLLLDRGMSPEFAHRVGFRTCRSGTQLHGINHSVPGIAKTGKLYGYKGFMIPATAPWGDILGLQYALDARKPKYLWQKFAGEARDGRLPIFSAYDLPDAPNRPERYPSGIVEIAYEMIPKRDIDGNEPTQGGAVVSASIFANSGKRLETATKTFKNLSIAQVRLNALLLGLEISEGWVDALEIRGVPQPTREQAQFGGLGRITEGLARICRDYLDRRSAGNQSYSFTEDTRLPIVNPTEETEANGDRYFDTRRVWLCDGAAKAHYAAYKHKIPCFGYPMASFHSNPHDFYNYTLSYAVETYVHAPDAGDVTNQAQIPKVNAKLHAHIHNLLHREVEIAWWGQLEKGDQPENRDLDELDTLRNVKYISADDFLALHKTDVRAEIDPYTFVKAGIYEVPQAVDYPRKIHTEQPKLFPEGQRLPYVLTYADRCKIILDTSFAGAGKSRDFDSWTPEDLNCRRLIHVTNTPVDPNTSTPYFRGRDNGRYYNESDDRILSAPLDHKGDLVYTANCKQAKFAHQLSEANIAPESKLVCQDCPFKDECESTAGMYWYEKKKLLAEPKFRTHPSGLSLEMIVDDMGRQFSRSESGKPGTVIILDDVDPFVQTLSISGEEILEFIDRFSIFMMRDEKLCNLLRALADLADSGVILNQLQLLKSLPPISYNPDLAQLVSEAEEQASIAKINDPNDDSPAPKRWFSELYKTLCRVDVKQYHVHAYRGRISVTMRNQRFFEVIQSAGVKLLLIADATARAEDVRRWFGADTQVPVIAQERPEKEAELTIYQIIGAGDCGYNRSEKQIEAIDIISRKFEEAYVNNAVINTKKSLKMHKNSEIALCHRSSSRGSNRARNVDALLSVGTPRANVSALAAKWTLMTGSLVREGTQLTNYPMRFKGAKTNYVRAVKESVDPEFAEFAYRNTQAEIEQGYARTRYSRRAGQKIVIYHLTEFPLDREVEVVDINEMLNDSPEIPEDKSGVTAEAIDEVVLGLLALDPKVTKSMVAKKLGVTTGAIRAFFAKPGRSWKHYLGSINRETLAQSVLQHLAQPYHSKNSGSDKYIYSNDTAKHCSTDYVYVSAIGESDSEVAPAASSDNAVQVLESPTDFRVNDFVSFVDHGRRVSARLLRFDDATRMWQCEPTAIDRIPVLFRRVVSAKPSDLTRS